MTRLWVYLAVLGSAGLLAGAFLFQFMGYPPCKMCLWQRWPHAAAIVIGVAFLTLGSRFLIWMGALAVATTAAIGFYHAGVEQDWWEGPSSCTGGGSLGADLLSTDITPIVMCDEISWALFGLSMASWNALISLGLIGIWITAARAKD